MMILLTIYITICYCFSFFIYIFEHAPDIWYKLGCIFMPIILPLALLFELLEQIHIMFWVDKK